MHLKKIFNEEKILRCILYVSIPAGLFYSLSVIGLWTAGFKIMQILRDPADQSGQSSFLGFVSNIGIWLWVSSAAICFFCILNGELEKQDRRRELLFLVGMLSIILAFDDLFLIHDRYIEQEICFLAYAIFAGALLIRHYELIMEIDGFAFLFAGSLLALSVLTDLTQDFIPLRYRYVQIFEEGFKFVGGATWLYFAFRVASFRPGSSHQAVNINK